MQVTIKERPQTSGNKTLYLEYYETGFRKRENLHITIYPESFRGAKKLNKEAYAKAQTIRSERILNPPSFLNMKDDPNKEVDERAKIMTWKQWARDNVEYAIREGNVKKQIDHKKVVSKRIDEYLQKNNYEKLLLKDVKTEHISGLYMFNRAYREGLIPCNPVGGLSSLEKFPVPDTHREYLTAEELERFLRVEIEEGSERIAQKAFGFACFTALRLSDMRRLRWSNIKPLGDGLCVQICQQKTKNWVTVPLNEMALSLLPEHGDAVEDSIIFPLSKKPDWVATLIRRVCEKAGIEDKDITFHCSRHTAASLAISTGADISTVSKILGHKSTTCTQVYAKVSLESRIEVMNLTDGVFD